MRISNFNVELLKSSDVHTNTFHASNQPIRPYGTRNPGFIDLGGFGILRYFIPYCPGPGKRRNLKTKTKTKVKLEVRVRKTKTKVREKTKT